MTLELKMGYVIVFWSFDVMCSCDIACDLAIHDHYSAYPIYQIHLFGIFFFIRVYRYFKVK